jgi:hypothetical protein
MEQSVVVALDEREHNVHAEDRPGGRPGGGERSSPI